MAFWSKKIEEFEEMDHIIHENPGISAAELARELDVEPSTVMRRLPSLEEAGYLYYEDEEGRLWPFDADDGD
ncbi:MAG: winged helix-turn-helix transcriptional regulator [Anaerolineae bacterium]|nr:winged helix-turn-helix transcriptional regulator [Anaerolineae bacterium]